jgi:hypothetical protein
MKTANRQKRFRRTVGGAKDRNVARNKVAHLFDLLDLVRPGDPGDYEYQAAWVPLASAFTDRLRNAEGVEVAAYRACLADVITAFESACE